MKRKILVAGIGNIFLGDDAFGVEVVNRLHGHSWCDDVTVADFGIRSFDLAYSLMGKWDLIILVDAIARGGQPGTVYVLQPDMPEMLEIPPSLDAHTMTPVSVLQLVQALGGQVGPMLVVGCEPKTLQPDENGNFGLSLPVNTAVDEAIRTIEEWIERSPVAASAT
jgi:hydrogenase maturation protease